jgi:hypothetical protein
MSLNIRSLGKAECLSLWSSREPMTGSVLRSTLQNEIPSLLVELKSHSPPRFFADCTEKFVNRYFLSLGFHPFDLRYRFLNVWLQGSEELVQETALLINLYGFTSLSNVIMSRKVGERHLSIVSRTLTKRNKVRIARLKVSDISVVRVSIQ